MIAKSPQKQQTSDALKAHQILSKFDEKNLMKTLNFFLTYVDFLKKEDDKLIFNKCFMK